MELWHVGLCMLCYVVGVLIGAIVSLNKHDKIRDTAYKQGYCDGRMDEDEERTRRRRDDESRA